MIKQEKGYKKSKVNHKETGTISYFDSLHKVPSPWNFNKLICSKDFLNDHNGSEFPFLGYLNLDFLNIKNTYHQVVVQMLDARRFWKYTDKWRITLYLSTSELKFI